MTSFQSFPTICEASAEERNMVPCCRLASCQWVPSSSCSRRWPIGLVGPGFQRCLLSGS